MFLADGGRIRGTIIEDTTSGVAVLLPDGTTRRLARAQVRRIEYESTPGTAGEPPRAGVCPPCPECPRCPPPPPPRYAPPRTYGPPPGWGPPPYAQPGQWRPPPPRRGLQGALALQYAVPGRDAATDLRHRAVLPAAVELEAHLGWKLTDRLFLGAYAGGGAAVPGRDTRELCDDLDDTCDGSTTRAGLLVKVDVRPGDAGNVWLALGSGVESHRVDVARLAPAVPGGGLVLERRELELKGLEPLRVLAGIDFRSSRTLGVGVFAALSFGRYRDVTEDGGPDLADGARETHSWFTVGVRGLLFP